MSHRRSFKPGFTKYRLQCSLCKVIISFSGYYYRSLSHPLVELMMITSFTFFVIHCKEPGYKNNYFSIIFSLSPRQIYCCTTLK